MVILSNKIMGNLPWCCGNGERLIPLYGGTACGARGGGPCVARRCLQTRPWCYSGVQFNLLARSPIPDPSPFPVPTGDWGSELRGSSVSRTLQRRLRCVRLRTPVLAKGVLPFSLPWLESVERARLGIPSLAFRPLKEQTAKNISVGPYSSYRACISWSFPTWLGVMSLARTCTCKRKRLIFWRQWWRWLDNHINLRSSHPPSFPCACHYPDVYLSRIWYGPDNESTQLREHY